MRLKFASYNIHKAVGTDGRRDPERILAVLREIDADVVALQEVDRRYGRRASVLPRHAIDEHTPYRSVEVSMRPDSLGWHGNAILVRRGIEVVDAARVPLPTNEPRGAIRADLRVGDRLIRVMGMHLDLSGLRRRQQVRSLVRHLDGCAPACPTVLLGDTNELAPRGGCLRDLGEAWTLLAPGRSFPAIRPLAQLDRIIVAGDWRVIETKVHHSAHAAKASDHLPVFAALTLPTI